MSDPSMSAAQTIGEVLSRPDCVWWDDAGMLHVDFPAVLAQLGLPYTPENEEIVLNATRRCVGSRYGNKIPIEVTVDSGFEP